VPRLCPRAPPTPRRPAAGAIAAVASARGGHWLAAAAATADPARDGAPGGAAALWRAAGASRELRYERAGRAALPGAPSSLVWLDALAAPAFAVACDGLCAAPRGPPPPGQPLGACAGVADAPLSVAPARSLARPPRAARLFVIGPPAASRARRDAAMSPASAPPVSSACPGMFAQGRPPRRAGACW